jgi:hypothetical protein
MPSRRYSLSSSCLFVILISMLVLAQSSRAPLGNQRNGLPNAQEQHPGVLPNLPRPQGAPVAQRRTRAAEAPASTSGSIFDSVVTYGSDGFEAVAEVVADVNGDGKPDLLVLNVCAFGCSPYSSVVGVLLGNGDGTFQPAVTYETGGANAFSMAVADVNGDGKPDLLVANISVGNNATPTLGVLLGNGDGTFQPVVANDPLGYSAYAVAVSDVNGDGKLDLVVANLCPDVNCKHGVLGVLLGNGDGTFQPAVNYDSGGWETTSVAVADVNGDGKPDLLAVNWLCNSNCHYGSVGVLLGKGDGTFQPVVAYGSGGYDAVAVAVADVNGDGKPDLLVANDWCTLTSLNAGAGVLLGNGDGTFQPAVTYCSGGVSDGVAPSESVAVADVNGDGKLDLLMANYCPSIDPINGGCTAADGSVGVLLGNGDGSFQTAVAYDSGGYLTYSVAVADVNGDGAPDLMVANLCASSTDCSAIQQGSVGVLINTHLGATATSLLSSPNPSTYKQAVTFTATVTSQGSQGTPTGVVSFFDGTTNLGSSALNASGVAVFTISSLVGGTHSMTAAYSGDSSFSLSTSRVLNQVVQGAIAQVSPTSLNFGKQTVGITSAPQSVTLINTGNAAMIITSIGINGVNGGDFAQTNNCPSSLAPSNSCAINVTFTPTTFGTRNASVSIADNAPNSPQLVLLTGAGIQPFVTLSPPTLNFGNQTVGTTTSPLVSTLMNTGHGTLTITSIGITGKSSGDFAQTNNCGTSVSAGDSCSITVTFKPSATGTQTAAVSIRDNAPNTPQKVPLTGVGVLPAVTLSPTSLAFPTQVVFTTSKAKTVTLTNTGLGILNVSNIAVTGPFTQTNTCGSTVNAGASCAFTVTFAPTTIGALTSSISITDNALTSPQKVTLKGTGTYVQLTPTSLNFANQPVGTKSLSKTITLSNKGDVTVSISGISITGTNASDFAQSNTCGNRVAAGASCFITVTFTPSAKGSRSAAVSVSDNGGGSPQKVALRGTGT